MKKNILIIFVLVLVILIALVGWFLYNKFASLHNKDLSKISDSQIISILEKNADVRDYVKVHPDFKIKQKEILTKESITAGQNGTSFKEVYLGLELQDNRYMRIDLINFSGDRGMITVIDFKNETVLKAYGIILLTETQAQVQAQSKNGQTPSPTTNP
jgi:hypothetical protein